MNMEGSRDYHQKCKSGERQILYDITCKRNLKHDTNDLTMKQKQSHRHREQTCCQQERGGGRDGLGLGDSQVQTSMCWTNNKVPLYSAGN